MKNNKYSPIFVTGIERSGSSIIARILKHYGIFSGHLTEMYESREIKSILDKYYQYKLGINPNGQFPLPQRRELHFNSYRLIDELNAVFFNQCANPDPIWFYKSSRLAQTWPIWSSAFPNAKWIIVRRRSGDIIQSCLKTGYMNAFNSEHTRYITKVASPQEGWLWWVHRHEEMFVEMIEAGLNCKIIWPERMATGDFQQMQETIEWLGLEWDYSLEKKIQPLFDRSPQKTKQ